jgi:tellurite methyltransferase
MQWREWVLDPVEREGRLGTSVDCPLCDRAELPEAVRWARSASWDEGSLPAGLRRAHRLGSATWGRISVQAGRLRFTAATSPPIVRVLEPGLVQAIPPGVVHEVQPDGPVSFTLDFFAVDRGAVVTPDEGGDPACWSSLVCPECGGVRGDGTGHRPGCSSGTG